MKCPFCSYLTADDWQTAGMISGSGKDFSSLSIDWMRCANEACQQTVVRMREVRYRVVDGQPTSAPTEWIARPRGGMRSVDPLVPEPLRTEYREAAAILDLSPRMSAALSRQVLSELLANYAHLDDHELTAKIERFTADPSHPLRLRADVRRAHGFPCADVVQALECGSEATALPSCRHTESWLLRGQPSRRIIRCASGRPAKSASFAAAVQGGLRL